MTLTALLQQNNALGKDGSPQIPESVTSVLDTTMPAIFAAAYGVGNIPPPTIALGGTDLVAGMIAANPLPPPADGSPLWLAVATDYLTLIFSQYAAGSASFNSTGVGTPGIPIPSIGMVTTTALLTGLGVTETTGLTKSLLEWALEFAIIDTRVTTKITVI